MEFLAGLGLVIRIIRLHVGTDLDPDPDPDLDPGPVFPKRGCMFIKER